MACDTFIDGPLTIELEEGADAISVRWRGKSTARDPGRFILPVLTKALEQSSARRWVVALEEPAVTSIRSTLFANSRADCWRFLVSWQIVSMIRISASLSRAESITLLTKPVKRSGICVV